ncbi:hypothetical protein WBG78_04810 [Chryseolinea sp. T2]|uniref:hypothetical protein n=1 Tax=Chryseolinea sp. T2 TaxID=3129255 RepID=UPI003077D104
MLNRRPYPLAFLLSESYALLSRMEQMKPFELTMPMVKGASVSTEALKLIGQLLLHGKTELGRGINRFINLLRSRKAEEQSAENLQGEFTVLKLRYNQILDQLDIFADVLSQRSEHEVGIWLSGLDALAENGLEVGRKYYEMPSLMVYLDRGHGAAIRRARTRLPGGDENPIAVIQIPRERMVGNGIASSLIHEVGHQAAALLDLVTSLRHDINMVKQDAGDAQDAWLCFDLWISEIIADFWAVAQLGVSATLGLMSVVTLPDYFQFRMSMTDPHPVPYIRVQLSCRMGARLFPDSQWDRLWKLWETFYPTNKLPQEKRIILQKLDDEMDRFIDLVLTHMPEALKGKQLIDVFEIQQRQPQILRETFQQWKKTPALISQTEPLLVFAILGQAKADHSITTKEESQLIKHQLNRWAMNR